MPEEVTVRYRWDAPTLTEAFRWHQRAGRRGVGRSVILVSVFLLLGYTYYRNHFTEEGASSNLPWILGVVVFYVVLIVGLRRLYVPGVIRRNLAKSPLNDSPMDWRITADRLFYEYAHGKAEMAWTAFMQVVQTPAGLLLYPQPLMFHWLPRTSFASEADYEQVVKWAYGNVPTFRPLV